MYNPNSTSASLPNPPAWLLANKINDVGAACVILCDEDNPSRSELWFELADSLKTDSGSLYAACCQLLAADFDLFAWWFEDDERQAQALIAKARARALAAMPQAVEASPAQSERRNFSPSEILEMVLDYIVGSRVDITADRKDWLVAGAALKSNLPEAEARRWFVDISRFYPGFSERECLATFRSLKGRGYAPGALYAICGRHGISVQNIIKSARNLA